MNANRLPYRSQCLTALTLQWLPSQLQVLTVNPKTLQCALGFRASGLGFN